MNITKRNIMKNLKYHIFTLLVIVTSTLIYSCSSDNYVETVSTNTFKSLYLKCSSSIEDANPKIVTLTQYTRENPCLPDSQAVISTRSSTYTLYIRGLATPGKWTVYSGTGITFEKGYLTAYGTTVKIYFASDFKNGSIQAIGSTVAGEIYGPILNFSKK